jgi:hypothetical protein
LRENTPLFVRALACCCIPPDLLAGAHSAMRLFAACPIASGRSRQRRKLHF